MKVHEYQARELLRSAGIPVPPGVMIDSIDQAAEAYRRVTDEAGSGPSGLVVVKAQVHAGGRGKAGFVKLVRSAHEATDAARFMLTHRMVSVQTGPQGLEVKRLLVAAGVEIAKEYYLAIATDRKTRRNVLIASREGGVEIETVAHQRPEAIIRQPLHPTLGLLPYAARRAAFELGFTGKHVGQAVKIMSSLAGLVDAKDCSLAEINPLVLTAPSNAGSRAPGKGLKAGTAPGPPDGQLLAIDAKFNFDDNATFRHPDIAAMFDPAEENPAELRARRFGLSYIALDGTIGCLVNGAGLAMATMDIVKLHGAEPANFLDVGGSVTADGAIEAFHILLSDPKVKGILVNIFGGIMNCDVIAQGIINAAKTVGGGGFKVPLVVRLEGTNVQAGRKLLESARKDIPTMQAATDLADAARKVTGAVA